MTHATGAGQVSFSVDPWDPGYGLAFGEGADGTRPQASLPESAAELTLDLELPPDRWRPVTPDPAQRLPRTALFLDGVRRIDASIWVHGTGPQPSPGIAASLAAGLVACDGAARITDVLVERGLFTTSAEATDLVTRHARYPARLAAAAPGGGTAHGDGASGEQAAVDSRGGPDPLSLALQRRLADAEVRLAMAYRTGQPDGDDLLIVDGPLRGRGHLDRTVGYIKTHHASYLPAAQAAVVSALAPGERTPVFGLGTTWRRTCWYLALPGTQQAPWAGVVRLECPADLPPARAAALADLTARLLPPLASAPHKDPRAPQNLVPIGGLERELRRRLGDQRLLYRSLRAAATGRGG